MLTGDLFVKEGLINDEQLQAAVDKQIALGSQDPIARVMIDLGYITEKDRVRLTGKVWGIPFIELSNYPSHEDALSLLDPKFARKFKSLPLEIADGKLKVAMANPLDVFVIDEIRVKTGLEVDPYIAVEDEIMVALPERYQTDSSITDAIEGVMKDFDGALELSSAPDSDEEVSEEELREMGEDAPIIRLANLIINTAVTDKASDIHIEPRKDGMLVRYRIDGVMVDGMRLPRKVAAPLTSRLKIVANMDIAEKRAPQDNRISAVINGREYDFRVSTLPVVYGEKIVMRVLDKGSINVGLEKLGFLPRNFELLQDMAKKSYGIVLVTGPTGSGKSTTLYSLINQTNDGLKNIITIEDPVEYELQGINQCNVNNKAGMTFAAGLRAMLRQDPDVIMVGEMRDRETATIAMEAALTGHLVFSTLHTNDAPSAPGRLMDMEVEPFLIASSIVGILAQRLVRCLCPKCSADHEIDEKELEMHGLPIPDQLRGSTEPIIIKKAVGCDYCKGTGFKGRTGVHELLSFTDEIRNQVLEKAPSHVIRELAMKDGMSSLQMDATEKILRGVTSIDEVVRVIYS